MGAWEDLATVAPGAGLGSMVLGLFGWTLRTSREDRLEYRAALKAVNEDHREILADERSRAAEDRATAEAEIGDLRRRLADAQMIADNERAARREAQIKCEQVEARMAAAYERLADLRGSAG